MRSSIHPSTRLFAGYLFLLILVLPATSDTNVLRHFQTNELIYLALNVPRAVFSNLKFLEEWYHHYVDWPLWDRDKSSLLICSQLQRSTLLLLILILLLVMKCGREKIILLFHSSVCALRSSKEMGKLNARNDFIRPACFEHLDEILH